MKTQITVSNKKNATHITGNSGTSCAIIACVCVYVSDCVCGNGTTGQDHRNLRTESQHQPRLGS